MSKSLTETERVRPSYLLLVGVLTSAVSSVCCIGPFFFLATGISGAWMSRIMMLKSYYPIFAVTSLACIFAGGWLLTRRKTCASVSVQQSISLRAPMPLVAFLLALLATIVLLSSEHWIVWLAG
jgi:hypothetical protein